MAQRKHTREEISGFTYLKIEDIRILFGSTAKPLTYAEAKKIYQLADQLDDEELGEWRLTSKVRTKSACKVQGLTVRDIRELIKNEGALAQQPSIK